MVIGLKHDLINVMSEIETKLHEIHASGLHGNIDSSGENTPQQITDGSSAFISKRSPFAKVDKVSPGSVAETSVR